MSLRKSHLPPWLRPQEPFLLLMPLILATPAVPTIERWLPFIPIRIGRLSILGGVKVSRCRENGNFLPVHVFEGIVFFV
jgi:hypothetical protein